MKIFIEQHDNRFVNNLIENDIRDLEILSGTHKNNLYRIHEQLKINAYIFSLTDLDHEAVQFIIEYGNSIKIFVYHNILNNDYDDLVDKLPQCTHLQHNKKIDRSNIIEIPDLINKNIYIDTQQQRDESIIFFMDEMLDMPNELLTLLYPKTKKKIKMYGGYTKHHQNLGMVTEYEKASLLNRNKYYLSINGYYQTEAIACGCRVLSLEDILSDKIPDDTTRIQNAIEYSNFITSILI